MGIDDQQTGKEVQDVKQIDRDSGCGVYDDCLMCEMWVGGLVVVDLRCLVVLVV